MKKISKYIFKNLKQKFKEIEIYNLLHLKENGYKLSLFQKLSIMFSGLEPIYKSQRKLEPEFVKDLAESEPEANE